MRHFKLLALIVGIAIAGAAAAGAGDAGTACPGTGEGLLTVSHNDSASQTATVVLDRVCLESLPRHTIKTSTLWIDHVAVFEGVRMRDLLASLNFDGDFVVMTALNDYRISAPVDDFTEHDVLLAYRQDGATLEIRDKRPLWLVYPLDGHAELANEQTYAKMIWQLQSVIVE
jgi:hypothetical protein